MRIDIRKPEGNTIAALGIAKRLLQQAGCDQAYTAELARDVFLANSAAEARKIIEDRTGGAVTFFDSGSGG